MRSRAGMHLRTKGTGWTLLSPFSRHFSLGHLTNAIAEETSAGEPPAPMKFAVPPDSIRNLFHFNALHGALQNSAAPPRHGDLRASL